MPNLIQSLIDAGDLVLYHDYRAGHTEDLAGNGHDGTITTPAHFVGKEGIYCGPSVVGGTGKITVTDHADLQLTQGCLFVLTAMLGNNHINIERIISKRDAGSTSYELSFAGGATLSFRDSAAGTVNAAAACDGNQAFGVNFVNGAVPDLYVDGVFETAFSGAVAMSAQADDLIIGNNYATNLPFSRAIKAVLIFNRALTATEHAQLYAELQAMKFPQKAIGHGSGDYDTELLADGDMEAAGTGSWSAGNGATLTKQPGNAMAGVQVLRVAHGGTANPYAIQNPLTVGTKYRATGFARGDGTGIPRIWAGADFWTGTAATAWQQFDITFTASNVGFACATTLAVAGYCEFDQVSVREVLLDRIQFKTDWDAKTIANIAPGSFVPGTPIMVDSGAFAVEIMLVNGLFCKVLRCTNNGRAHIPLSALNCNPTTAAYGTWDFWLYKGTGATYPHVMIICSHAELDLTDASQNAYGWNFSNTEGIWARVITAGAASQANRSGDNRMLIQTWYRCRITRNTAGQFHFYMNNELVTFDGSGSNPFTATAFTTSNGIMFYALAGDILCLGAENGENGLIKYAGVVAP